MQTQTRRRSRPLTNIDAVRKEMATLYYAIKHDTMAIDKGKALTYILSQVAGTFKSSDAELEEIIKKLQDRTKDDQTRKTTRASKAAVE